MSLRTPLAAAKQPTPLSRRNKCGTKADTFVVVPVHCPVQICLSVRVEFHGKRHYGIWRVKAPANTGLAGMPTTVP